MILDEFTNIGRIVDFEKKLATTRSRGINIFMIFQNIAQLKNRYDNDVWQEILGNADTKILRYNNKAVNSRNIVAFDIVMEYLDRNVKVKKAKHPVNVTMQTNECTYDIIAIKEKEIDALYENIDKISKSDKVIIIIETKNYIEKHINTQRPCCICTYPPVEIMDRIN